MGNINSNYNYSYKHIKERIEALENNKYSTVYKHHFDFIILSTQTGLGADVTLRFNCISSNPTPYSKFKDLDGDGFIVAAFGNLDTGVPELGYWVFEARLLYQGNLLVYASNITTGNMYSKVIQNVGETTIFDSVTKI